MGPHRVFFFLHYFFVASSTWEQSLSNEVNDFQPLGFYVPLEPLPLPTESEIIGVKNPSRCKSCCTKIEITSTGDASNYWPDTTGQYDTLGSHNGKNCFSHQENSNLLYWNDDNVWAVGENYKEAKLFTTAGNSCPQDTHPWYYFSNEGTWLEDGSVNVACVEQADCCEEIELISHGGSSDLWGETRGIYSIEDEQHNGKLQYKHKENNNKMFWNDDDFWAISDNYLEAKMYSPANADCPDSTDPWFYFSNGGWLEDATVNIGCGGVHECCNVIEITRSSEHWGDTVGEYNRMPSQHNGKSQFQHISTVNLLYWNNNNDFGAYWAIGEDYEYAKLYSMDGTTCPKDTSSWMYFGDDGLWYDDNTMEIFCKDSTTIGPNQSTTTAHGGTTSTASEESTIQQGDCLMGWIDASNLEMGCLYVDVETAGHHNVSDAQAACEKIQPGSHLVEIFNDKQMTFLRELLADIEVALGNEEGLFWWLSLRTEDMDSGVWTWPFSGQQAEYTYWADGEPIAKKDYNCAQMLSALLNEGRWWAARCFDDYPDELHVCQIM